MNTLEAITTHLLQYHYTVTCAESCTGGLLASELTKLPGSSAWFNMGFITYSNEAKHQLVNVKQETLEQYGAVSEETVREMAQGALSLANADFALSISGFAGPTGGTVDKPIGTVWFGLASKHHTWAKSALFIGGRDAIRHQAVDYALAFLAEQVSLENSLTIA